MRTFKYIMILMCSCVSFSSCNHSPDPTNCNKEEMVSYLHQTKKKRRYYK